MNVEALLPTVLCNGYAARSRRVRRSVASGATSEGASPAVRRSRGWGEPDHELYSLVLCVTSTFPHGIFGFAIPLGNERRRRRPPEQTGGKGPGHELRKRSGQSLVCAEEQRTARRNALRNA